MSSNSTMQELYDPYFHTPQPDLYEVYAELRRNHPVFHNEQRDVWCVSRYADVQTVARDWKTFSSADGVDLDVPNYMGAGDFLDSDPPRHDVLRNVLRPFFLPKEIAKLQDVVRGRVENLMAEIRERDAIELVHEVAWSLPVWVIERLLGASEDDDERLERLVTDVVAREPGDDAWPARAVDGLAGLKEYAVELAGRKRREPGDDLMSALVAGTAEGAPTEEELVGMTTLLFIAGSETTASLLSNALALVEGRPEALEILRGDDEAAVGNLIEEVLRYESPIQYLARTTTAPAPLADDEIPAGARVVLLYGSANRDTERWEDAGVFDPARPAKRNLSFGEGIHFCLGAPLARLEAKQLLPAFAQAVADFEIVERERLQTHVVRGWQRLDARIDVVR